MIKLYGNIQKAAFMPNSVLDSWCSIYPELWVVDKDIALSTAHVLSENLIDKERLSKYFNVFELELLVDASKILDLRDDKSWKDIFRSFMYNFATKKNWFVAENLRDSLSPSKNLLHGRNFIDINNAGYEWVVFKSIIKENVFREVWFYVGIEKSPADLYKVTKIR